MVPRELSLIKHTGPRSQVWWRRPWVRRCDGDSQKGYWNTYYHSRCKRSSTYEHEGEYYCPYHGPKKNIGPTCEKCGRSVRRGQQFCLAHGGTSAASRKGKYFERHYRGTNIRGNIIYVERISDRIEQLRSEHNPLEVGRNALFTQLATLEEAIRDYDRLQSGEVGNPDNAPVFDKKNDLVYLTNMAEKVGMTYSRVVNAEAKHAITASELTKTKEELVGLVHSIIESFVPIDSRDEAYGLVRKHYGVESQGQLRSTNSQLTKR
jgi:hypothetical protein